MKRIYSNLTFKELTKDLAFIKVFWNNKLVYDDTDWLPLISLDDLMDKYGDKVVYKIKLKVVEFHHCIIWIKGEK